MRIRHSRKPVVVRVQNIVVTDGFAGEGSCPYCGRPYIKVVPMVAPDGVWDGIMHDGGWCFTDETCAREGRYAIRCNGEFAWTVETEDYQGV